MHDKQFTRAIQKAVHYAHNVNLKDQIHFPVVAVSHAYLLALRSAIHGSRGLILKHEDTAVQKSLRLAQEPEDTFIYDEMTKEEALNELQKIYFQSDLDKWISYVNFMKDKRLSRTFMPIETIFNGSKKEQEELVAAIEGIAFPFYGLSYRVDKN